MKSAKWLTWMMSVILLSAGAMAVQAADPMTSEMSGNELVGTITRVDGLVYTIRDFRGASRQVELQQGAVAWGSPAIGSQVKARIENDVVTELISLDE